MFDKKRPAKQNFLLLAAMAILVLFTCVPVLHAAETCGTELPNEIKGKIVLPSNCSYKKSIKINQSDTSLDCQNSTFVGNENEKIGLTIDSEGRATSNITIKNCNFINYSRSGVRITWSEVDADKGNNHQEIYERTPAGIHLENITVRKSGGVGIYLDDYVSDITIINSRVFDSGGVGIYLEHSSRNIKLLGNEIGGNGFGSEKRRSNREGVAIDSSANNLIENNTFRNNAGGGIFLYKNCGENFGSGRQVIRWQHSDHNIIRNNFFSDEKTGVWLASRQRKNLTGMKCGDSPVNNKGWYADFADFNKIENNTFCRTGIAVNDYGKANEIAGSKISCPSSMIYKAR